MSSLGKKVKDLRLEKKLTHKKLAEEIGCAYSLISEWENDLKLPSANSLTALVKFFKVSADYLLGLENEDGSKNY